MRKAMMGRSWFGLWIALSEGALRVDDDASRQCDFVCICSDATSTLRQSACGMHRSVSRRCASQMDPSWTETAEERAKREREYLSKHVIGGVCVWGADVTDRNEKEPAMTRERERELDAYFEQLDRERESLSQIYQRVGRSRSSFFVDTKGESRERAEGRSLLA